jgi:hypothetical protein
MPAQHNCRARADGDQQERCAQTLLALIERVCLPRFIAR